MLTTTLLVGSALGMLVALVYLAIGWQQAYAASGTQAFRAHFAIFWIGIGLHALVESVWALWVGTGNDALAVGIVVLIVKITTGLVGFLGLVAYMLLVYTGRRAVLAAVAAFYAALYPVVLYDYVARVPIGVETRTWFAGLQYASPEGALHAVVAALLFVPPLAATLAYAALYRVAGSPSQRRRILYTSLGLGVFFGGFLLGWLHEQWHWWGLIERLLPLAASLAVLRAHAADRAPSPLARPSRS